MRPQLIDKVRLATTEDSEALGLITVSASMRAFIGQVPEESLDLGWRPQDSAAGWSSTLEKLPVDQFVLVAEIDGRLVGFVWCGLTDAPGEGQIKGLYVLPTLHGQGIGRELLGQRRRNDWRSSRDGHVAAHRLCRREPELRLLPPPRRGRGLPATGNRRRPPDRGDLLLLVGPLAATTHRGRSRVTARERHE